MYSISTTSQLYQDFKEIDASEYHSIVRFFELHQQEIQLLKFDHYFDLLVCYSNALFEIGAYERHLEEVDKVIQFSIQHNIKFYKGEDIYFQSLFRKAASLFNLFELEQAEHILKELLKMSPHHGLSIHLYKKCLRRHQPDFIRKARALSIALFLGSALITAAEVLFVRPFFSEWKTTVEIIRILSFTSGFLLIGLAYWYHYLRAERTVKKFVKAIKKNRKR